MTDSVDVPRGDEAMRNDTMVGIGRSYPPVETTGEATMDDGNGMTKLVYFIGPSRPLDLDATGVDLAGPMVNPDQATLQTSPAQLRTLVGTTATATDQDRTDERPALLKGPAATQAVIECYQQMVYAICVTHTMSRPDADDAFQEVFLTYHRKQPVCRDDEHRKAWLIRTALTVTRRITTGSWRRRVVLQEAPSTTEVFRFEDPRQDQMLAALSDLPPEYRTIIHLFYFEDLPIARIAGLLEMEPGTVKMRLSRGRAKLRQMMTKEDSHV